MLINIGLSRHNALCLSTNNRGQSFLQLDFGGLANLDFLVFIYYPASRPLERLSPTFTNHVSIVYLSGLYHDFDLEH
jgi:hypothetical protein